MAFMYYQILDPFPCVRWIISVQVAQGKSAPTPRVTMSIARVMVHSGGRRGREVSNVDTVRKKIVLMLVHSGYMLFMQG